MGDPNLTSDPPAATAAERLPASATRAPLTYERRPVGRVLVDVDDDGETVTVRVFADAGRPWGLAFCYGFLAIGSLGVTLRSAVDGSWFAAAFMGLFAAGSLLATYWTVFGKRAEPITFVATPDGLAYHHVVLGEAFIPRGEIADLIMLPEGRSGMSTLSVCAHDGTEGILGGGPQCEVATIDEALRKGLRLERPTSRPGAAVLSSAQPAPHTGEGRDDNPERT